MASGGGMLISPLGEVVVGYVGGLGACTNNWAKGMALLWGINILLSIGIKNALIEGGSKLIIDAVEELAHPS